ncbi:MAG: acylphosphatase [Actinomycetota bacterium]|nr:acylphosphatase [Actinomycetota bacterium]
MGIVRRQVIVRGEVQGVGFRMNARAEARRLGLSGVALNRRDGSVEVQVEGPDAAVAEMVAWLRRGPRYARVTSVTVEDSEPLGDTEFTVH